MIPSSRTQPMQKVHLTGNVVDTDIPDYARYKLLSEPMQKFLRQALAHAADKCGCEVSELRWDFGPNGSGPVPLKIWPPKTEKKNWWGRLKERIGL